MVDITKIVEENELTGFQKMILEMLALQLQEDLLVHEKHGTSYGDILSSHGYFYALLDEFGEWNHERKPEWCWWKQNAGEIDQAKVIEEFSDITHFILSYHLACYGGNIEEAFDSVPISEDDIGDAEMYIDRHNPVQWIIVELLGIVSDHNDSDTWRELFGFWICLYKELCLDFKKDIYEPYIKKNAINQKRVEEGY